MNVRTCDNLVGEKFHKFTVIALDWTKNKGYWVCKCDCGEYRSIRSDSLKTGKTKSCGCYNQKVRSYNGKRNKTHGMSGTKVYSIWNTMRCRCQNENSEKYADYGGRGIKVCDRWNKFENFYEDIGKDWFPGASIERVDVDGNYEPNNCKWILQNEQQRNQRSNAVVMFKGKKQKVLDLAKKFNLKPNLIRQRLSRGWTVDRALTERPRM